LFLKKTGNVATYVYLVLNYILTFQDKSNEQKRKVSLSTSFVINS